MKKNIFILAIVAVTFLAACSKNENTEENNTTSEEKITTVVQTEEETTTERKLTIEEKRNKAKTNINQPFLKFYKRDANYTVFEPVKEYSNDWIYYSDIGGFYSFPCDEVSMPYAGFTDRWMNYWNSYTDFNKTKIGYEVEITLNDGEDMVCTIKTPKDTEKIFKYVELYLYDDVHQSPGAWYSHLLETDMNENTLMTSIKVTTGEKIEDVNKIILTVFTYENENEFDYESGRYIGGNFYTINIGKK